MMRKLIYHVATSIDGYIAQENHNIDLFPTDGDHIPDYLDSLTKYDTSIMGRNTYEFGYRYGLEPGANPYPHMQSFIYSTTISFDDMQNGVHIIRDHIEQHVQELKKQEGTPIYLCGGGILAAYLIRHHLIDEVHVKLNPIIIGSGIELFHELKEGYTMSLIELKEYNSGVILLKYKLSYN